MSHLAHTKQCLQQTAYAYLIPLKERAKSRFLNLPELAQWVQQIRAYLKSPLLPQATPPTASEPLADAFAWLSAYNAFLDTLISEIRVFLDR